MTAELTKREIQISELIAWGASKKDVASLLFISEHTVDKHVRHIYEKTGCTKINELSAWWFCKHFNISFSLSPLATKIVSIALLILFSYGEIKQTSLITQQRNRVQTRTERIETRSRTQRLRREYEIA
ncbi:MAG: helix-turn-helix transcriptional regulator [Parabacteroides sp.]|nr:helix-turn-helix transcriptional regulator [Parabacteroides sp.]